MSVVSWRCYFKVTPNQWSYFYLDYWAAAFSKSAAAAAAAASYSYSYSTIKDPNPRLAKTQLKKPKTEK